eukprot:4513617-Ditylum_brightwellii.AAC.1
MVDLSQNWLSWVGSLDIRGCQGIQVVINSDWDVKEQEWLRLTLTNALPNVLFCGYQDIKMCGKEFWAGKRWWLDGEVERVKHWLKFGEPKGWKDTKFENVIFATPRAPFMQKKAERFDLFEKYFDLSPHGGRPVATPLHHLSSRRKKIDGALHPDSLLSILRPDEEVIAPERLSKQMIIVAATTPAKVLSAIVAAMSECYVRTPVWHHPSIAESIGELKLPSMQTSELGNYLKAVKSDDAAVEERLWNDRLLMFKGVQDSKVRYKALDTFWDGMLRRYRISITCSFVAYLKVEYGNDWATLLPAAEAQISSGKQKREGAISAHMVQEL